MGAQLRIVRRRIRSVQSTKKITRAMELIASSRIVKAQQRVESSRPYESLHPRSPVGARGEVIDEERGLTVQQEGPEARLGVQPIEQIVEHPDQAGGEGRARQIPLPIPVGVGDQVKDEAIHQPARRAQL